MVRPTSFKKDGYAPAPQPFDVPHSALHYAAASMILVCDPYV